MIGVVFVGVWAVCMVFVYCGRVTYYSDCMGITSWGIGVHSFMRITVRMAVTAAVVINKPFQM